MFAMHIALPSTKYSITCRCRDDDLDYFGMIGTVLANQAVVILPSLLLCDILQLLPRISTAPIGPAITLRIITSLFGFGIVHDGLMYVSHRCILHRCLSQLSPPAVLSAQHAH